MDKFQHTYSEFSSDKRVQILIYETEKLLRTFELFCWWEVKLAYRPASYLNVNLGSLNAYF